MRSHKKTTLMVHCFCSIDLAVHYESVVGPYWDIEQDIPIQDYIRQTQLMQIKQAARGAMFTEECDNLNKDDGEYLDFNYRKIVKSPVKGPKFTTVADWFLFYKGRPYSIIATCVIILPILFAGLIQTCIDGCRSRSAKISRRTWEFPLVPVLLLQQTRREYLLRKKTVRRFCIQWEVGRINIRMNTKLVDLRQILHPPRKQKKVHKYTTWRIIRLITRFNAFLATRKAAQQRSTEQLKALQKARIETWNHKINTSRATRRGGQPSSPKSRSSQKTRQSRKRTLSRKK
ncbi:unnamed protein product [Allacma fusca]|uniref:Uncharacterized protein n=1 Tax=Allacma fusca TaxID=39272 RepID=A0A8J2JZ11_9HEXA|nr:unnamed protein product [Allacma fusca]